jgi:hypothetical protein
VTRGDAAFANDRGQLVAQINPEDLTRWLVEHRGCEIVSVASVGQFVIIVHK